MKQGKKQLETIIVNCFRYHCSDFPTGKVLPTESPDFIVKIKTRYNIGMEITQLTDHAQYKISSTQLIQQGIKERIIGTAKSLFEKTSSVKLFVVFCFKDDTPLNRSMVPVISARLANIIRNAIPEKGIKEPFCRSLQRNVVPDMFQGIFMAGYPFLETSVWQLSNIVMFRDDEFESIKNIIKKKEAKLTLYQHQKLNSLWLIIVAIKIKGGKNYNIYAQILKYNFTSLFNRVYLFELISGTVIQLV